MEFENLPVKSYTFDSYDIENLEIPALLFQTGYLTIKKITIEDEEREAYDHSIIYLVLKLNGAVVRCEDPTNSGRIDALLESLRITR